MSTLEPLFDVESILGWTKPPSRVRSCVGTNRIIGLPYAKCDHHWSVRDHLVPWKRAAVPFRQRELVRSAIATV